MPEMCFFQVLNLNSGPKFVQKLKLEEFLELRLELPQAASKQETKPLKIFASLYRNDETRKQENLFKKHLDQFRD